MKRHALVIGATGATGSALVEQLIADDKYDHIHVLHYRITNFDGRPKVISHVVKLEDILNFRQIGIDDVFCCIGTTIKKAGSKDQFAHVDRDLVIKLGKWAKIDDVISFHVISAQGASEDSPFFYNRVKGEMEQALTDLNLHSLYIYHPPLLKAKRKEFRLGERIGIALMDLLGFLMIGSLKKFKALAVEKLASKMIFYAEKPEQGLHIISAEELNA